MLLFLWTDDSMTGAVASDHIEPVVHVNWDGSTSPEDLADTAYDAMAAKDAGRRCLFFRHFADGERTGHVQIGANSVEDYMVNRRGEFDKMRSEQYRFWTTWGAKGDVRPDMWSFDDEQSVGITLPTAFSEATWADRAAKIAKVNNHPVLSRYSPEQLRPYSQAQIAAFSSWNTPLGNALMHWDDQGVKIFCDTLRDASVSVYANVLGEAPPPTTNYGDEFLREKQYGLQTEPYHVGNRSINGISAPYLYLNRFNSLPPIFTGQTNAHRWLMFLKNNNWMRACRRTSGLRPWLAYPSHDELNMTGKMTSSRYMVQAAAAMGVEYGMMWSPGAGMGVGSVPSLSTQLAYMEATLADLPARQVDDDERMTQLAYNATSVTIGSWSVTYSAGDWGTI